MTYPNSSVTVESAGNEVLPAYTLPGRMAEYLIVLLLVAGFFVGPLKLLGISWLSYLGPDALAALVIALVFADNRTKIRIKIRAIADLQFARLLNEQI